MTRRALHLIRCAVAGTLLAVAATILAAGGLLALPLAWLAQWCMPTVDPPERPEPRGGLAWAVDDSIAPERATAVCVIRGGAVADEATPNQPAGTRRPRKERN